MSDVAETCDAGVTWRGSEEEEREGAARIVPGRRGEGARKRGGENTCAVRVGAQAVGCI